MTRSTCGRIDLAMIFVDQSIRADIRAGAEKIAPLLKVPNRARDIATRRRLLV